jgi:hypothetical protein
MQIIEMMLLCPRCGDYYADAALAFCLADGTPLVSLDLSSERALEGSRIIEQKEKARRKQKKRQHWWGVSSVMTMLILTMIAYGVVAKRYIYLVPAPASPAPPPTPSPSPLWSRSLSPTPSPSPSLLPSPTIVIRETPTPTIVIEETPTPIVIKQTPTPTIVIKETPTPIMIMQTPTPRIVIKETPTTPECSESDRSHAKETILSRYRETWQRRIESERNKIIAQFSDGPVRASAELGPVEYETAIVNQCTVASVRARYVWRVYSPVKPSTSVPREKRFTCVRVVGAWLCP